MEIPFDKNITAIKVECTINETEKLNPFSFWTMADNIELKANSNHEFSIVLTINEQIFIHLSKWFEKYKK